MKLNAGRILCITVLFLTIVASALLVIFHAAKPDHLLTILGIIAGIAVVVFQLGEQQEAALELQRENARQELRLRVYEQLKEKAALAYESSSKVQRYTRSILSQLELYVGGIKHGMPPWNIELRAPEFLELSSTADSALVALIVEIEQWEVSFASADLFRWAFGSASRDIGEAFDKLFNAVVPVLPTDKRPPEQGAFPQPPVSEQQLEAVGLLAKSYLYECDELHCYLHDLIVEAQNELVSPLFNRRVAIREPLDVRHKVITESQRHALLKYFKEDSAVGVAMAEARARVVARLSETNPPRAAAPE